MKFENTWVGNFEGALRGMRNPKNSWNKSDSYFGTYGYDGEDNINEVIDNWMKKKYPQLWEDYHYMVKFNPKVNDDYTEKLDELDNKMFENCLLGPQYEFEDWTPVACIGPQDMELAQRLIKAGPEHRKFLRQIFVSVDITAPMYIWSELDTYKVATVANSTSKMHKLSETPITLDCFETDDFNKDLSYYAINTTGMLSEIIIEQLEYLRLKYLETKDKRYWKELVRWLPESWLQKRTWTANYETIRAICSKSQRRNHKLNEWSGTDKPEVDNFIKWARTLPYAQWFIFDDEEVEF